MNVVSKAIDRLAILRERARGLDVSAMASTEQAGLDASQANHYAPSGDRYLAEVLKAEKVAGKNILDVGCGKGSAMLVMLKFPFARVDGLEVSRVLAFTACRNIWRVGAEYRSIIILSDAREFTRYGDYAYLYFYNPFPESVMAVVLSRVPKSCALIYNNPVCYAAVERAGWHKVAEYPNRWGTGINVYR